MNEPGQNHPVQQTQEHDPVCGMKVDPSKAAASLNHEGVIVYFCSQGCAAKFRAAPEKYLLVKPDATPLKPSAKTEPQGENTCPNASGDHTSRSGPLSEIRHGIGKIDRTRSRKAYGIYMPDASADCARCTGRMLDMRHGAGTSGSDSRRRQSVLRICLQRSRSSPCGRRAVSSLRTASEPVDRRGCHELQLRLSDR